MRNPVRPRAGRRSAGRGGPVLMSSPENRMSNHDLIARLRLAARIADRAGRASNLYHEAADTLAVLQEDKAGKEASLFVLARAADRLAKAVVKLAVGDADGAIAVLRTPCERVVL